VVPAVIQAAVTHLFKSAAVHLGMLPAQRVVRALRRRDVDLETMRALEVFGFTGERFTKHYAPLVASLEVWEKHAPYEAGLRRNLPGAEIKITDSFAEVARCERTYDLIVVDNPIGELEHFDLFPHLFRLASQDAVLVLLVTPEADARTRAHYNGVMGRNQLERRREFYATDEPEHIPLERMVQRYGQLAGECGFALRWAFSVQRSELFGVVPRPLSLHYLVVSITRVKAERPGPAG
jgi:hypothetical protein